MKLLKPQLVKYYNIYKKKYLNALGKKNTEKMSGMIYVILTLFTVSFFGFFAISPTLSTISNLQKQKEDSQKVLQALEDKLKALQSLDNEYRILGPKIDVINNAIPESTAIPTLTRQIENLAEDHNLSVKRLEIGTVELYPAVKKNSPVFSFTFNVSVEGNSQDANSFLQDLINFQRIVTIERVSTGKTTNAITDAFITGRVYFYK